VLNRCDANDCCLAVDDKGCVGRCERQGKHAVSEDRDAPGRRGFGQSPVLLTVQDITSALHSRADATKVWALTPCQRDQDFGPLRPCSVADHVRMRHLGWSESDRQIDLR